MPATLTYNEVVDFPPADAAGEDMTHWGIYSAETGGTFYMGQSVSNDPDALAVGENWQVAAGQVVLTFSDGDGEPEWALKQADLNAGETYWLSAHTGDPGTTGADESADGDYARQELTPASWVTAQT